MEFSFERDEEIKSIILRRGEEAAKIIFSELKKRYDECNSRGHCERMRGKDWCSYCFRTLDSGSNGFRYDLELRELNDWYAGLIALERERFRKKLS